MPFEFGDVVLLPFPFTDQSGSKKRPAVIVSNNAYNIAKADVVVMAITSQLKAERRAAEVWVRDWQNAGLLKPSAVKSVFATVEQSLVLQKMGALATEDRSAVAALIDRILG